MNADSIENVCDELCQTLRAKNANYGDSAAKPPFFLPWLGPESGLWVRLGDKVERLKTLKTREEDKVGESLRDTLLDTAGYAVLLVCALDSTDKQQHTGDYE